VTKCKKCKSLGCAARGKLEGPGVTCYGYMPITNGDRLRSMTNKELSEFILGVMVSMASPYRDVRTCALTDKIDEWLEQEVWDGL